MKCINPSAYLDAEYFVDKSELLLQQEVVAEVPAGVVPLLTLTSDQLLGTYCNCSAFPLKGELTFISIHYFAIVEILRRNIYRGIYFIRLSFCLFIFLPLLYRQFVLVLIFLKFNFSIFFSDIQLSRVKINSKLTTASCLLLFRCLLYMTIHGGSMRVCLHRGYETRNI